jgi:phage baseplate assembly protein V
MNHRKNFDLTEAARRIANLVMLGTVTSTRGDGYARVKIGELTTGWLPWLSPRMGNRKDWAAPEPAEQVLVLCHNGDLAQGVIVASLGSNSNPNPSDNPRIFKTVYSDGTFVQIDLDTHEVLIRCAGNVSLVADGDIAVATAGKASVEAVGDIEAKSLASIKAFAAVEAEVTAPVISLTGAVTINGTLTVTGMTALATATVGGVTLQSPNDSF